MKNKLLAVVFLFFCQWVLGQVKETYQDTLMVSGNDAPHLSGYAFYYIDTTAMMTPDAIIGLYHKGQLQRWKIDKTLNLGLNPHPVWLYLNVKYTGEIPQKYWWSLYSHADSVRVYQKNHGSKHWGLHDVLSYDTPMAERTVKTRFLASEFLFYPQQGKELLLNIKNVRHSQHAVTDFTTPTNNLLWEKNFYWNIGFFAGCFLLIAVLSLCIGVFTRQKIFLTYCGYLVVIALVLLSEELLITVVDGSVLFAVLKRMHALPLSIIAAALHFYILKFIVQDQLHPTRFVKIITQIIHFGLVFGMVFLVGYFFGKQNIGFQNAFFIYLWYAGIAVALMMVVATSVLVFVAMFAKKLWWAGLLVAIALLYLNPVGYFLNYSGIFPYYKLTYPNYFYLQLCLEFIVLGCFITWRYQKTIKTNFQLLQEKALREEQDLHREIEVQQTERKRIARDLHDNLGATLSVIKLIITNSYANDKKLVAMISRANTDLRHFFSRLYEVKDPKDSLFKQLEKKTQELNSIDELRFVFIGVGNASVLSKELSTSVFLMASELLSNALKHSQASEVTLQILIEDDQLQLVYEDNGKGFRVQNPQHKGMGIANINTRVRQWDGEIYTSSNKLGTTTIITLPL